jgi:hypothetical protein
MLDGMEKDPKFAQANRNWEVAFSERRRAALRNAELSRLAGAGEWWMLATGCALAGVVLLYVSNVLR